MAMMSAGRTDDSPAERDEIEALLPWYVSGKLDAPLTARVARYIEAHPELDNLVALAREESDATISVNEAIEPLGARSLDRLRASIAAHPRKPSLAMRMERWRDALTDAVGSLAPSQVALAGSAAALLILLQAGVIGVLMVKRGPSPVYQTAAGPQGAQPGIEMLVRFKATATAGEINALLKGIDARIVGGPRAGLYRLRVAETDAEDRGRAAAQRALQQSGLVGVVLPGK
jgi:hypothetical protein